MTHDHLIDDIIATRPKAREARAGDGPGWLEQKYDGHRVILIKDARGFRAYGRKLREDLWSDKLLAAPSIAPMIERIPPMTVIEGEVHAREHAATSVRTLLNVASQELLLAPFAIPMLRGEDHRDAPLQQVYDEIREIFSFKPPVVRRCLGHALTARELDELKTSAKSAQLEGFMLKLNHWSDWFKIKHSSTLDCIVYAELGGIGKFAGMLGSLMIGVLNREGKLVPIGKVGGGFSNEERALPRGSWKDAVIEVRYQSVQAKGRLQFPQFVRRRDDKPASECLLEQLGLE